MSKLLVLTSGSEVLLTKVAPDDAIVTWVPIDILNTPPQPAPVAPPVVEPPVGEPPVGKRLPSVHRHGRFWTAGERELAMSSRSDEEVARLTHRTKSAVASYRIKNGLRPRIRNRASGVKSVPWTEDEYNRLLDLAGMVGMHPEEYATIMEFFPGRTLMALHSKHRELIQKRS